MNRTKYDDLLDLAKRGDVKAQYEIGIAIVTGRGIFTDTSSQRRFLYDPNYGIEFLRKAANQNYGDAYSQLGFMYLTGDLLKKDLQKYFQCTMKAAQLGSALGANNLGWAYYTGEHVPRDLATAFYWTKKSGDAGCPEAMETLAMMYWNGEGTAPDFQQAIYWLNEGANRGNQGMIRVREQIQASGIQQIVGKIVLENCALAWRR